MFVHIDPVNVCTAYVLVTVVPYVPYFSRKFITLSTGPGQLADTGTIGIISAVFDKFVLFLFKHKPLLLHIAHLS